MPFRAAPQRGDDDVGGSASTILPTVQSTVSSTILRAEIPPIHSTHSFTHHSPHHPPPNHADIEDDHRSRASTVRPTFRSPSSAPRKSRASRRSSRSRTCGLRAPLRRPTCGPRRPCWIIKDGRCDSSCACRPRQPEKLGPLASSDSTSGPHWRVIGRTPPAKISPSAVASRQRRCRCPPCPTASCLGCAASVAP